MRIEIEYRGIHVPTGEPLRLPMEPPAAVAISTGFRPEQRYIEVGGRRYHHYTMALGEDGVMRVAIHPGVDPFDERLAALERRITALEQQLGGAAGDEGTLHGYPLRVDPAMPKQQAPRVDWGPLLGRQDRRKN